MTVHDTNSAGDSNSNTLTGVDLEVLEVSQTVAENRFSLANTDHPFMQEMVKLFVMRLSRRMARDGIRVTMFGERLTVDDTVDVKPGQKIKKFSLADLKEIDNKLASLPDIFRQIQEVLNNPKSSSAHVAEVISKDMSLAARLLKLANSAFYGFPRKIDSLANAVTIIGSRQIMTMAAGISVINMFKGIPSELIDMKSFWKHSIACGVLAKLISGQSSQSLSEERFFVCGLLHDIGRLIMLRNYSFLAQESLVVSRQQKSQLAPVESGLWGLNHATIAGELFRLWNFPEILDLSVRYHHEPLKAKNRLEPGIIHLADIIAHSLDVGKSGNWFIPALEPEVWELIGFSESIIPFLVNRTDQQLAEIVKVFFDQEEL